MIWKLRKRICYSFGLPYLVSLHRRNVWKKDSSVTQFFLLYDKLAHWTEIVALIYLLLSCCFSPTMYWFHHHYSSILILIFCTLFYVFKQWWAMEFWRAMWQRDWADQEWYLSHAISTEDDCFGERVQRNEYPCHLSQRHENDGLSKGRSSINISKTNLFQRGEEIAIELPRLQPLVPPWRTWCLEWDTLCWTFSKPEATTKRALVRDSSIQICALCIFFVLSFFENIDTENNQQRIQDIVFWFGI